MGKEVEKAHKRVWELGIVVILLVITIYLNASGILLNPFQVVQPNAETTVESEYNKGNDFVKLSKVALEFTGYYKLDDKGNVIYYCYATELDKKTYFIFVPPSSTSNKVENPPQNLTDYSCIAKICEDEELFQLVAADYDLTPVEFRENYGVSYLVFDEARSDRIEMMVIWALLIVAFIISLGYALQKKKYKNDIGVNYIEE